MGKFSGKVPEVRGRNQSLEEFLAGIPMHPVMGIAQLSEFVKKSQWKAKEEEVIKTMESFKAETRTTPGAEPDKPNGGTTQTTPSGKPQEKCAGAGQQHWLVETLIICTILFVGTALANAVIGILVTILKAVLAGGWKLWSAIFTLIFLMLPSSDVKKRCFRVFAAMVLAVILILLAVTWVFDRDSRAVIHLGLRSFTQTESIGASR